MKWFILPASLAAAIGVAAFIVQDLRTLEPKHECEMVEFRVGDRTRWGGSTLEGEVCRETYEEWMPPEEESSGREREQPGVRGPGQSDR